MIKNIEELEKIISKVSLDTVNDIYSAIESRDGDIEIYRRVLEIIVTDILKK